MERTRQAEINRDVSDFLRAYMRIPQDKRKSVAAVITAAANPKSDKAELLELVAEVLKSG